jgi:predicted nucleotidyltransferase
LHAAQRYNFAVTPLPSLITDHLDEIRDLCGRFGVKRLAVFGSAVKGTFDPIRSDVDFVVEFETNGRTDGWHSYFDLKFAIEELLGRPIDLVGMTAVDNPYFRQAIELTQRELYAA